jgi:hypothetical protein
LNICDLWRELAVVDDDDGGSSILVLLIGEDKIGC